MRSISGTIDDEQRRAIAQFLALAASANVYFDLVGDRVVVRAVNPNWPAWSTLRHYLDEFGLANIESYFRQTSALDRQRYAQVA